jgi:DNA-binding NarL/FixJ family response regulator
LPVPHYTEQDMKTFMEMWNQYQTTEAIAAAIGRTRISVNLKARRMGLKRNIHTVRMVTVYGPHILQYGLTPRAIKTRMIADGAKRKLLVLKIKQKQQEAAIEAFQRDLHLMDRTSAVRKARAAGALLNQIGDALGLTKQTVFKILEK